MRECGGNLLEHGALSMGEIKIALLEYLAGETYGLFVDMFMVGNGIKVRAAIPVFAGEAREGDDGRIGEDTSLFDHGIRKLRFGGHAGQAAHGQLGGYVILIKRDGIREDGGRIDHLAQAFVEIGDIGHGDITAAAAALDVIDGSLAKERNARTHGEREGLLFILEQHHALARGLTGQADMLGAGRYTLAVGAEGNGGLEIGTGPLFHRGFLPEYMLTIL